MAGEGARQSAQRLILIVEDNELNLKLLKDVTEYHGYATVVTDLVRSRSTWPINTSPT